MAAENQSPFSTRVSWRLYGMRAERDLIATAFRNEGEALALLAEAYARDPEFYRFLRDQESHERSLDENTTSSLEPDAALSETLHGR